MRFFTGTPLCLMRPTRTGGPVGTFQLAIATILPTALVSFLNRPSSRRSRATFFLRATPRFLAAFEEGDSEGVPSSPILINPVQQKKYDTYRSTIYCEEDWGRLPWESEGGQAPRREAGGLREPHI